MLNKRVAFIREQNMTVVDHSPVLPDIKDVHYILIRHGKELGFFIIAITLRTYVRSSILLKKKSKEIYRKIKSKITKKEHIEPEITAEKKEASAFLKTVSEYKKKIGRLKDQIIEEETNIHG
ncbi:MAG: hypothetical protein NTW62_01400 [Candidatus Nomurabacteria bacterium]|nr:hypothetical protein [Candidatus Nomurabacteria bacterium]